MLKFYEWVKNAVSPGTAEVYCVTCKATRRVVKQGYAEAANGRRRMRGRCKTCEKTTSTFA